MRSRSSTWNTTEVALPVLAALGLGAVLLFLLLPHPSFGQASTPNTVRIYASVPRSYLSIVHGAQMAVDEAGGKAGNYTLEYVPLMDDKLQADGTSYHWDADVELANARRAAGDPAAVAYLGTYNSGAAKISIPVLNRVHLAMISPGNTYPGLTKPGTGTAGEPWIYYPLGVQNYFRVVPADDLQGRAAAAYAKQIGAKSVYVFDDAELYGHGIAVIFAQAAAELGLTVAGGPESIPTHPSNPDDPGFYSQQASAVAAKHPDLVYFGGITDNHPALLLRALRQAGFTGTFMGADGIEDDDFIKQAGPNAGPAFATLVGLPANHLTGEGAAAWYQDYQAKYGGDKNQDFAPFGYEAARVAISAIARAGDHGTDREAVRAQVASATSATADLPNKHILGTWQFDSHGDTSLVTISVLQMGGTWAYQGGLVYDPQTKTWSFKQQ